MISEPNWPWQGKEGLLVFQWGEKVGELNKGAVIKYRFVVF